MQALTRRALCLDLVGAASFSIVEKYNAMLMRCLQEPSPPGYRQVDVAQILKADQRAWLRMSETVKNGLKRDASGNLPVDLAFPKEEVDPQVCFQLRPLPSGSAPQQERPAELPGASSRPDHVIKGKGKNKGKLSVEGQRCTAAKAGHICWDYNFPPGFASMPT